MKVVKFILISLVILGIFSMPLANIRAVNQTEEFHRNSESFTSAFWGQMNLSGQTSYGQFIKTYRSSDNKLVYTLDTGSSVNGVHERRENILNYLNLRDDELHRVRLLAFYGYQHAHRDSERWFCVTQFLISNMVITNMQERFMTNAMFSRGTYDFRDMMEELEAVVESNIARPSFKNNHFSLNAKEELVIIDDNNVLGDYTIKYNEEIIDVEIQGDTLKIKALKDGMIELEFIHKDNKSNIRDEFYVGVWISQRRFLASNGYHPNNFDMVLEILPEIYQPGDYKTEDEEDKQLDNNQGVKVEDNLEEEVKQPNNNQGVKVEDNLIEEEIILDNFSKSDIIKPIIVPRVNNFGDIAMLNQEENITKSNRVPIISGNKSSLDDKEKERETISFNRYFSIIPIIIGILGTWQIKRKLFNQ